MKRLRLEQMAILPTEAREYILELEEAVDYLSSLTATTRHNKALKEQVKTLEGDLETMNSLVNKLQKDI